MAVMSLRLSLAPIQLCKAQRLDPKALCTLTVSGVTYMDGVTARLQGSCPHAISVSIVINT